MVENRRLRLLLFNLAADADATSLGFTTWWINALAPYCEYMDVVTMRLGRLAVAPNVRVWSIGKEKGFSEPRRAFEFYRILITLLTTRKYGACFAHMNPLFAVLGWPLLKLYHIPITLWYAHKSVTWKLRVAEKVVARVVTPSPESFRINSHKTIIVGHGIDTNIFVPVEASGHGQRPFTILVLGRVAPVKHLEFVIDAVWRLTTDWNHDNIRVKLIGGTYSHDTNYESMLRQQVIDQKLDSIVDFVGPIPFENIMHEYQQADVLVSMSSTGSADKVVLEAMSCGLPVITSNEAFSSILQFWADILLVPEGDSNTLATRLHFLISMPAQERRALGQQLRREVEEKHNLSKLIKVLVSYFTSDSLSAGRNT